MDLKSKHFKYINLKSIFKFIFKSLFGYSWKLKTEKDCSKIIFKYVNNTVGPIFNEKIAEKWNLWIRKQCTKKSQKAMAEKRKKKKKNLKCKHAFGKHFPNAP